MSATRLRELGHRSTQASDSTESTPYVEQSLPSTAEGEVVPRSGYQMVRGIVDPLAATVLVVACVPVFAVVWSAIRLTSSGPALFRQQRIGKNGKPFTILKFRTMQADAPTYSIKVADHDPAVTRVGRFLRRSGLDELPQLWNVLRGDMAIIGPRPEQMDLYDLYEPWQRQRHVVKPGITGWWQIHHRDGVPLHMNVDKDLYYIKHQGPMIDLRILMATCGVVLRGLSDAHRTRQVSYLATTVEELSSEVESS
jgi:lipopolysaccharide/colanic/teichoic acid biosynthesis glycosyltransferase